MSLTSNPAQEKITEFTLEKHRDAGTRLRKVIADLEQIGQEITAAYGDAGEMTVRKAEQALEEIRGFLDLQVFLEHPARDGKANAEIYYPEGHKCRNAGDGGCGNGGCSAAGKCGSGCGGHPD